MVKGEEFFLWLFTANLCDFTMLFYCSDNPTNRIRQFESTNLRFLEKQFPQHRNRQTRITEMAAVTLYLAVAVVTLLVIYIKYYGRKK